MIHPRVLMLSHSHPAIQNGGAEIAAFKLYEQLLARAGAEAWFMACSGGNSHGRLGSVIMQPFSDREYLYAAGAFDWFKFANRDPRFPRQFTALLRELQPDILHFHHYINFGVEAFQQARLALPNARIVVTLHEYLAICHHFGQMITTKRHLCPESSYTRCNACFPDWSPADFFLRKSYITQFFGYVDRFVAPSAFLAERYIGWGIPEKRMEVIENVVAPHATGAMAARQEHDVLRIGFFGQISWLKGCNILFDAADILERAGIGDVVFDIFGDYRGQRPEFQQEFLDRLAKAGRNVAYHGPYENSHVDALMANVDAVLVPSVWWENSPVVIQEALRNRRPVICSALGGMAEKIRDGLDGLHFRAGSAPALAHVVRRVQADRTILDRLQTTLRVPASPEAILDRHLALYAAALADKAADGDDFPTTRPMALAP